MKKNINRTIEDERRMNMMRQRKFQAKKRANKKAGDEKATETKTG